MYGQTHIYNGRICVKQAAVAVAVVVEPLLL